MKQLTILIMLGLFSMSACDAERSPELYDLALINGRVMDPESGLDGVRNIGITGGTIAAISKDALEGREIVDVGGLVVAPGFIDLNGFDSSLTQDMLSRTLQARDGVTTSLELEAGTVDVDSWYSEREGRASINYGVAVSHPFARVAVFGDPETAASENATQEQVSEIVGLLRAGLDEGALGVGFAIQYQPGATRGEILRTVQVAAEAGVPSFVHIRSAGMVEPGSSVEAVQEMIANSAVTGGAVHIVHIGSSGLAQVPVVLEMIEGAQSRGVDITTDVYPYDAAATHIGAAIFDPGWRARLGADYGDLEWAGSGERLDKETFHQYRSAEPFGMVVAHIIPPEMVELAVAHPVVMIESDAVPVGEGPGHPRGAGSFSRVLGVYVRERGVLTLMEALRKQSLMPAQRLENVVPAMARKGRVQVGADADLTIFDPDEIIDRATFADPAQPSEGIVHVLVGGTFVVRGTELMDDLPGRPIRRP